MDEFKGRHFDKDIILTALRWYCKYPLSLRDIKELLSERNIHVDHSTIYRWNIKYIPEIKRRITKQILGFKSFQSASILIDGIEISAMIKKGQVSNISNISEEFDLMHNQLISR